MILTGFFWPRRTALPIAWASISIVFCLSAFKTSTNGNRVTVSDEISGLEESDAQGKNLDVYVNGQLLSSGSSFSGNAAATTDYMIADATNIAFSFDLEIDDIVQIVKRG